MSGVSIATGVVATDPTSGTSALSGTTITASSGFYAPDGTEALPSYTFTSSTSAGFQYFNSAGIAGISVGGVGIMGWAGSGVIVLPSGSSFAWGNTAGAAGYTGTLDIGLARDAAGTMAQKQGSTAQTFRVYGTTTGPKYSFVTHDGTNGKIDANSGTVALGGTAVGIVKGTATNDSATAGYVGEYISSTIVSGSAVNLTTATTANMTSISLTAGDWEVSGVICFKFGATTSYTNLVGGVSSTTATLPSQEITFDYEAPATVPTAGKDMSWVMPTTRISISGTTTIFAAVQGVFTVSTLAAYGILRARRVR